MGCGEGGWGAGSGCRAGARPCSAVPNPFLAESPLLAAGSPRCAARGSQPALAQTSRVLLPPFPCSPALCWGCVCRGRALSSPVGTRCAPPCRHGALHEDVQVSPLCATLCWASSCCAAGGAGREGGGCACERLCCTFGGAVGVGGPMCVGKGCVCPPVASWRGFPALAADSCVWVIALHSAMCSGSMHGAGSPVPAHLPDGPAAVRSTAGADSCASSSACLHFTPLDGSQVPLCSFLLTPCLYLRRVLQEGKPRQEGGMQQSSLSIPAVLRLGPTPHPELFALAEPAPHDAEMRASRDMACSSSRAGPT